MVVPDITNPFFAAVVKGLERAIPNGTFRILLASSDESAEQEAEVLADLTGRVDGFILAPADEQDRAPLALHRAGVPVVLLDREVTGGELHDVVLVDNVGGARAAAEHLLSLGHRRIGMINGPENTTPGRERRAGFVQALHAAGLAADTGLDFTGDFREPSGRALARRILDLPERPTALFTANNQMTIGALKTLRESGIRIPDELSVVGFDDLTLGSLLEPPLTCVTRADEEQGELTMQLLLERLQEDVPAPPQRIVLDAHLEIRGSTGPVSAQEGRAPARTRRKSATAASQPVPRKASHD